MLEINPSPCSLPTARRSPGQGRTNDPLRRVAIRACLRTLFATSVPSQKTSALVHESAQSRRSAPFFFSTFRTLSRTGKTQQACYQSLAHSLTHSKNITPAFPVTSPLFARSFTQEGKSTPLFSDVSALFYRNVGVGSKPRGEQRVARVSRRSFAPPVLAAHRIVNASKAAQ
jgi:hypothetical protein